jgi:hypothetical protein
MLAEMIYNRVLTFGRLTLIGSSFDGVYPSLIHRW